MNGFSPGTSPDGEDLVAIELSCHYGDAVWNSTKEELFDLCMPHLAAEGLLTREEVRELLLVKGRYVYPMYALGYKPHLETVKNHLASLADFCIIGRVGAFEYMDSDQCLSQGFELAEKIAGP